MALDEPTQQDVAVEAKGLTFLFDPYVKSILEEIQIDYDMAEDDFAVRVPNGPQSSC